MISSADMLPFAGSQQGELLAKAGFINIDLKKKVPMMFGHTNKAGELAWYNNIIMLHVRKENIDS